MEINAAYGASGLWDLDAVSRVGEKSQAAAASQDMRGGDTADISDEARRLYSEMIHKYDRPASGAGVGQDAGSEDTRSGAGAGSAGSGSGGGAGSASSGTGNDAESIRKQIQSLSSQLLSMTSQLKGSAADAGVTSKIEALQSQIAALEAQLNELEQAQA